MPEEVPAYKCRTKILKIEFPENKASYEKILFYIFNLFFHVEPPFFSLLRLYHYWNIQGIYFFSRVILFYLLYEECTVEVSDLFWLYRSAKVVDFLFRDKPWPISRNAIASRQKAYKWEGFLVHLSWHEMVFRVAFGMVPILLSSYVETITVVLINSNFYFMNAFTCTTHEA